MKTMMRAELDDELDDVRHLCPITAAAHDAGCAFHAEALHFYRLALERADCTHDTAAILSGVYLYVTRRERGFAQRDTHAIVVDVDRELEAAAELINGEAREIGRHLGGAHTDLVRSMRRARDVLRAYAARLFVRDGFDEIHTNNEGRP